MRERLLYLLKECSEKNWDGYGSPPVDREAAVHTERFLYLLPTGLNFASIYPSGDGGFNLEFNKNGPRNLLSIDIEIDGKLSYAYVIGENQGDGCLEFHDSVPKVILDLIHKVKSRGR
jgi:hypothetical protein